MDKAADTKTLEDQKAILLAWRANPFTEELFRANSEAQDGVISILTNCEVRDVETFFAHFTAVGHLRGLRQLPDTFKGALADIDQQLKEL